MSRARQPSSLSREVVIFVPTALLLLIVVAAFNLYLYRDAVDELRRERFDEARALASEVAAELARGPTPTPDRLLRLAPGVRGTRVRTEAGDVLAETGTATDLDLERHVDLEASATVAFLTAPEGEPAAVVALAPFGRDGRALWVQVELPAERLVVYRSTERRILYLNIAVVASLTLLVLLYLRRLLAPYESMLERARRLGPTDDETVDETEFLVATFERALAALDDRVLARRDEGGSDPAESDDIEVLERTLAPSLESGFLLLDRQGRMLSINALGAELLGVEPPPPGEPLEALLADHAELLELLSGTVERAAAVPREEIEIGPPGREASRRVLGLSAHPLRRDDGALRGFIVLFTDLTEARRRARRDEMSRSLSQLGEIAAGVAHEMRNGLGTLKGYLGLIDHVGDDESVDDYLVEMRAETEHLERVLNDFLSFARPGTARSEPVALATVVERACTDPALPAGRTVLEVEGADLVVLGDPLLLQRALRNLLDNALRAQREADPDQAVVVRLRRSTDRAVVEIDDRGSGLDPTLRDSLLQPFVSGRPDGVGLGLALTHRIAELHDGRLEIVEREGGGVRATFELPVKIDT